jgi:hypothetical protein
MQGNSAEQDSHRLYLMEKLQPDIRWDKFLAKERWWS